MKLFEKIGLFGIIKKASMSFARSEVTNHWQIGMKLFNYNVWFQ